MELRFLSYRICVMAGAFMAIAVLLSTTMAMAQTMVPAPKLVSGMDFLNERLPLPETERYNEGEYIDTGVGLSFGVDKRLSYYAGEYEEAVARFEASIQLFRYKVEIWVYLARSYFYMKSPDRARQTLELAQQVMPDLAEKLWQPLIASLLDEIRQRANQQQVQVDFYSPSQEEFFSLFRLYLFLEDHDAATAVIRSAEGRSLKMRGQATTASGNSRQAYVKLAKKWLSLADRLRSEISGVGVEVPQDSLLTLMSTQDTQSPGNDEDAEKQRVLQLRIDFYNATAPEFEELFNLYLQQGMEDRAAAVLATLRREIGREQLRASIAPTVMDEVEIQETIDELESLHRDLTQSLEASDGLKVQPNIRESQRSRGDIR